MGSAGFEEPLRKTLVRTVGIALVVGGAIALVGRKWSIWPMASLLILWPSFGGHWVEVWFLNWLSPRLSPARGTQAAARVLVWFAGGSVLGLGVRLTAWAFGWGSLRWLSWWFGGLAFVGVELVMHLFIHLRGEPNFYNGRG